MRRLHCNVWGRAVQRIVCKDFARSYEHTACGNFCDSAFNTQVTRKYKDSQMQLTYKLFPESRYGCTARPTVRVICTLAFQEVLNYNVFLSALVLRL